MSCNRCANQAQAAMRAAGVPARQTQAAWAMVYQYLPRCGRCGRFLSPRQPRCGNPRCGLRGEMQGEPRRWPPAGIRFTTDRCKVEGQEAVRPHRSAGEVVTQAQPLPETRPPRPGCGVLLPTLRSFDLDEMPLETVRQINAELENMFKAGMDILDRAFSQVQAIKAEFDARYPDYKPRFVMHIGKDSITLRAPSGPPEADEAYRQWIVKKERSMKNAALSMQGKWRHWLKHLFLEDDALFYHEYRLIGTDITVSISKDIYKGQRSVFVYRGDDPRKGAVESFSTQMGKSGGWLESLRRLVERRLGDEDPGLSN